MIASNWYWLISPRASDGVVQQKNRKLRFVLKIVFQDLKHVRVVINTQE